MADRSVVYRLIADASRFKSGMAEAAAAAKKTTEETERSTKSQTKAAKGMDMLGISAGTAAAAIGGKVIMSAANFEQAMSSIQAATRESASNMALLEEAALSAGAETAFSATEAAAAIENLAKAGVSTKDILGGGLSGSLDLAAAGQMEVAEAAEIASIAMTQFNLQGSEVPRVADALAAGAGKAMGDVTDLGMALKQSGLVAGQMGLTLEETTGTLAAFASAGLLGSDAGTSLKTMLLRLANPSNEAAKAMERFGINAYDANGNMVDTATLAGQLEEAFKGESQATRDAAMATIFGSDAIRAANVLYSEGQAGISGWTAEVSESGYAAETAAIQMDNLKGKWEEFTGALETAQIGQGDGALGPLGVVLVSATELLNIFNDLTDATDGWLNTVLMGPIGLVGRMFGDIKDTFGGTKDESDKLADSADKTGDALSGTAAASADLATHAAQTAQQLEAEAKALEDARKAATDTAHSFFNLGDSLNDAKVSMGQWIRDMAKQADALNNFTENAQRAAKRGLRDGLIAALKEAGPEGALRMRQLANATEGEIDRANAAWAKGQRAIDRYVDTTVPEKVLDANPAPAITAIQAVRREIQSLDGDSATVTIRTVRTESGKGPLAFDAATSADGSTVPKTGLPYADRHLYLLADGEEVISNRFGQADRHRPLLKAINAGRLADGGTAGDKDEEAKEKAEKARRKAEERREREEERRQRRLDRQATKALLDSDLNNEIAQDALELADAMRRLRSAKKANRPKSEILDAQLAVKQERSEQREKREDAALEAQREAADLLLDAAETQQQAAEQTLEAVNAQMAAVAQGTTSGFQTGLFDKPSSPWNANRHGPLGNLETDIAGLEQRGWLQTALAGAGLDGDALAAALSQGSNADLTALLADGGVARYEELFNRRAALTTSIGAQGGQLAYGPQQTAAQAALDQHTAHLAAIEQSIAALEANADARAELTGAAVGAAVNGGAASGQRDKSNRGKGGKGGWGR